MSTAGCGDPAGCSLAYNWTAARGGFVYLPLSEHLDWIHRVRAPIRRSSVLATGVDPDKVTEAQFGTVATRMLKAKRPIFRARTRSQPTILIFPEVDVSAAVQKIKEQARLAVVKAPVRRRVVLSTQEGTVTDPEALVTFRSRHSCGVHAFKWMEYWHWWPELVPQKVSVPDPVIAQTDLTPHLGLPGWCYDVGRGEGGSKKGDGPPDPPTQQPTSAPKSRAPPVPGSTEWLIMRRQADCLDEVARVGSGLLLDRLEKLAVAAPSDPHVTELVLEVEMKIDACFERLKDHVAHCPGAACSSQVAQGETTTLVPKAGIRVLAILAYHGKGEGQFTMLKPPSPVPLADIAAIDPSNLQLATWRHSMQFGWFTHVLDKRGLIMTSRRDNGALIPSESLLLLCQAAARSFVVKTTWAHSLIARKHPTLRKQIKWPVGLAPAAAVRAFNAMQSALGRYAGVDVLVEGETVPRKVCIMNELEGELGIGPFASSTTGAIVLPYEFPPSRVRPAGGLAGGARGRSGRSKTREPSRSRSRSRTPGPKQQGKKKKQVQFEKKHRDQQKKQRRKSKKAAKKTPAHGSLRDTVQTTYTKVDKSREPIEGQLGPLEYNGGTYMGSFPIGAQFFASCKGVPLEFATALDEHTDVEIESVRIWCLTNAPGGTHGPFAVMYIAGPLLDMDDERFINTLAVRIKLKNGSVRLFELGKLANAVFDVPVTHGFRKTKPDPLNQGGTIGHLYFGYPETPSVNAVMTTASSSGAPPATTLPRGTQGLIMFRCVTTLAQFIGQSSSVAAQEVPARVAMLPNTTSNAGQTTNMAGGTLNPEDAMAAARTLALSELPMAPSTQNRRSTRVARLAFPIYDSTGANATGDFFDLFWSPMTQGLIDGVAGLLPWPTQLLVAGVKAFFGLYAPSTNVSGPNVFELREQAKRLNSLNEIDITKVSGNPDGIFAVASGMLGHLADVVRTPANFLPLEAAIVQQLEDFGTGAGIPMFNLMSTFGDPLYPNAVGNFTSFLADTPEGEQMVIMPLDAFSNIPVIAGVAQVSGYDGSAAGRPLGRRAPRLRAPNASPLYGLPSRNSASMPKLFFATNMTATTSIALYCESSGAVPGDGGQLISWIGYLSGWLNLAITVANQPKFYQMLGQWLNTDAVYSETLESYQIRLHGSYVFHGSLPVVATTQAPTDTFTYSTAVTFLASDYSAPIPALGIFEGQITSTIDPFDTQVTTLVRSSFVPAGIETLTYDHTASPPAIRELFFSNPSGSSCALYALEQGFR